MSGSSPRPDPVPSSRYSEEIVVRFAGPDYRDFVDSEGRNLRPRLARSLDLADLRPGHRMLDLGCGRGEVSAHAAARGARVIAMDYSPDCVQLTRDATRLLESTRNVELETRNSKLDVVLADATSLPFPSDVFDRVTMLDVVEHLDRKSVV